MSLKTKVKSYSFWVSLASAVILILKLVGQKFGFAVDEGLISDLFTSLCAILVLLGIIVVPSTNSIEQKSNEEDKKTESITQVEKNTPETCEIVKNYEETKSQEIKVSAEELSKDQQSDLETAEVVEAAKLDKLSNEIVADDNAIDEPIVICDQESESHENDVQLENSNCFEISINQPDVEAFIDKVCLKRVEFKSDVANFVEFLQTEINNLKKIINN